MCCDGMVLRINGVKKEREERGAREAEGKGHISERAELKL